MPVIALDRLSEQQKRAYIIVDNKLAENAGWDEQLLRLELAALQDEDFNVALIGFEDEELARLLADQDASERLTGEDAAPELPEKLVSAPADLCPGEAKLLFAAPNPGALGHKAVSAHNPFLDFLVRGVWTVIPLVVVIAIFIVVSPGPVAPYYGRKKSFHDG